MTTPQEAAQRALIDAATSLETIARLAGKTHYVGDDGERVETYMGHHDQVRGYAQSRAAAAREALAALASEPQACRSVSGKCERQGGLSSIHEPQAEPVEQPGAVGRSEREAFDREGMRRLATLITPFAGQAILECVDEIDRLRAAPAATQPAAAKITEEQHVAAVKVLLRASGLDGLPQRMLDAMLAATQGAKP